VPKSAKISVYKVSKIILKSTVPFSHLSGADLSRHCNILSSALKDILRPKSSKEKDFSALADTETFPFWKTFF